ncbi:nucleolar protein 9 isoform X1 [Dermochelys coriacea]|uniref:nucleolar protein 9 isoform X1 n=1 Tax=Dermochelys coriacea TaxID=27794 RepID=UPI0018E8D3A2|nr:nucleolar protein 9 isoform X1 [Dermochelys coriacea]
MADPPRGGGDGRKRRRAGSDPSGLGARPRLDPDAAGYFRRAAESLRAGLGPGSERDLFVTNVLEEAVGSALPLALDPSGSLLLQALLPEASPTQLAQLLCPLLPALRQAACHPCGAHILEAALLRAPRLLGREDVGTLEELVLQLGRAVREELGTFAWDPHASFVVRTLLQVLGGVRVRSDAARGLLGSGPPPPRKKRAEAESEGPAEFEVPDSFLALLQEFIAAFQENLAEFITHRVASLCLQVALEVLHRKLPEACAELCSSVIGYLSSRNPSAGCSPLLVFLKDPVCSRVLDKVLEVSARRALRVLYRQHFRGQLRALAGHGVANFTLQRLIGAAPPKLLGKVLAELGPGLEEVLAQGHTGVATALLGACRRCGAGQQEVLQLLMEAFHCWEPPTRRMACAPLFASLLPYEVYYALGEGQEVQPALEEQPDPPPALASVSLHGSLLLQHLLHFADPSPVLRSLATLPPHDLVTLACSPAGSHVYDALLASPSVPCKPRRKVLRALQGHYVSLACNKHGSRVLDAIWSRATLPAKRQIAQELAEQEQHLRNDAFGHHLVRNFALTHFLKRRRDWDRHQEAETKRRELFAEILED